MFERCYTRLYSGIKWLKLPSDSNNRLPSFELYKNWLYLIGSPSKKIYEIGSGQGELISFLARCGFNCKATEITRERGQKCVSGHPNLSWGVSDGVHLERFESQNSYDAVISNQVIEHLHPDGLLDHFKGVLSILSAGGGYVARGFEKRGELVCRQQRMFGKERSPATPRLAKLTRFPKPLQTSGSATVWLGQDADLNVHTSKKARRSKQLRRRLRRKRA